MVGDAGLEPTTPRTRSVCASQLRQSPTTGTYYGFFRKGKKENGIPARPLLFRSVPENRSALEIDHVRVFPSEGNELGMGSAFEYLSSAHNENFVGFFYGLETVRHYDDGFVREKPVKRFRNGGLRKRIERGSRFVQYEDFGIPQEDARYREALAFAAGKPHSPLPNFRIETERHRRNEIAPGMVERQPERIVARNVGKPVAKVLANGSVENRRLLRKVSDMREIRIETEGRNVLPVDEDAAGIGNRDSEKEFHERRLSRSAPADHGGFLAAFERKRKVSYNRFAAFRIRKIHAIQNEFPGARNERVSFSVAAEFPHVSQVFA